MALQGPIPVHFQTVFPQGCFAVGEIEPMRDFDASKGGRFVQAKDRESGRPVWLVQVVDADPAARDKTVRVKIIAQQQPVLPGPVAGSPFVPVEFTGMTVTPYVNQSGRLGYSVRASGLSAPGKAAGSATASPSAGGVGRKDAA